MFCDSFASILLCWGPTDLLNQQELLSRNRSGVCDTEANEEVLCWTSHVGVWLEKCSWESRWHNAANYVNSTQQLKRIHLCQERQRTDSFQHEPQRRRTFSCFAQQQRHELSLFSMISLFRYRLIEVLNGGSVQFSGQTNTAYFWGTRYNVWLVSWLSWQ